MRTWTPTLSCVLTLLVLAVPLQAQLSQGEEEESGNSRCSVCPESRDVWIGGEYADALSSHFGVRAGVESRLVDLYHDILTAGVRTSLGAGLKYVHFDLRAFLQFSFVRVELGVAYARFGESTANEVTGGFKRWEWHEYVTSRNERQGLENDVFALWAIVIQFPDLRIETWFQQQFSGSLYEDHEGGAADFGETIYEKWTVGPELLRTWGVAVSIPISIFE